MSARAQLAVGVRHRDERLDVPRIEGLDAAQPGVGVERQRPQLLAAERDAVEPALVEAGVEWTGQEVVGGHAGGGKTRAPNLPRELATCGSCTTTATGSSVVRRLEAEPRRSREKKHGCF